MSEFDALLAATRQEVRQVAIAEILEQRLEDEVAGDIPSRLQRYRESIFLFPEESVPLN
jgi:hypothetical protein